MQKPVAVPSLEHCINILGEEDGTIIHQVFKSAEFRSAATLYDQLHFLQNQHPDLSVRSIIKLLSISNYSYYKAIDNQSITVHVPTIPPSRQLLTKSEEINLIQKIKEQQIHNDCWTSTEIRDEASQIFFERTGQKRFFSRDWFFDFKSRHQNDIQKVKANCVDDLRANISIEKVEQYFTDIDEVIKDPPKPYLLINLDEMGFGKRPEKGKRKTVYISTKCDVQAFWRERTDPYHISLVAAVTAACNSLTPLCLTTRKRTDPDFDDTFFYAWGDLCTTPKGYMTTFSMIFWIRNILKPYVEFFRKAADENLKCVLIIDGCTSHFTDEVIDAFDEIGNIKLILLPPHSSHLLQMLDATLFSSVKRRFSSIPENKDFTSRLTRKLIRIKRAYESSVCSELIRSAWEATGFHLNLTQGEVTSFTFDEEFKSRIRHQVSHQVDQ